MTTKLGLEDLVVTLMLIGFMGMASVSLRHRLVEAGHTRANQRAKFFFRSALGYVLLFMVCGVLHQTRTLVKWPAYVVFGVLIVIGVTGWIRLRKVSANTMQK